MKLPGFLVIRLMAVGAFNIVAAQDTFPLPGWPVNDPASQQMNADSLKRFDQDIVSGKYGYVDAMFVTRNGKLVYEKKYTHDYARIYGEQAKVRSGLNPHHPGGPYNYYNAWWHPYYRGSQLHSLQSVTKTITSVIIGVAITKKDFPAITTPVLSFFDTAQVKNIDPRKRRLTIKHLLTMTGGLEWNEYLPYTDPRNDAMIMEASFDWISYVINKPMANEPGTSFRYNSGGSQLLSHIFSRATGADIEEYAAKHLFSPLGISEYYWKRTPTGFCDTEGGLYLKAADLAKIGYLFLKDGNWNGQQLVNKDWVQTSVAPAVNVGPGTNYGFKWWLFDYNDNPAQYAWCGNGFGGQWPIIIPEYNIVAVFNGWNIGEGPFLPVNEAIRRLVNAVSDKQ